MYELTTMPECFVVVARGGEGVSTPLAYAALDRDHNNFLPGRYTPHDAEALLDGICKKDLKEISDNLYNIFEDAIFSERPIAKEIKEILLKEGALNALMSGSGTAVFGLFDNKDKADDALEKIKKRGYFACVATPTNKI